MRRPPTAEGIVARDRAEMNKRWDLAEEKLRQLRAAAVAGDPKLVWKLAWEFFEVEHDLTFDGRASERALRDALATLGDSVPASMWRWADEDWGIKRAQVQLDGARQRKGKRV